jgi:SET domain-containing protein
MKKDKTPKETVAKRSSAGLGLFAGQDIKKGDFIIEYVGEVITRKEADDRGGKYLFETSANRVVDGKARSNKARYINHACKPNAEVEIERGHINIYAIKNIKDGEEINYDYGEEYVEEYCKPCLCATCLSKKK